MYTKKKSQRADLSDFNFSMLAFAFRQHEIEGEPKALTLRDHNPSTCLARARISSIPYFRRAPYNRLSFSPDLPSSSIPPLHSSYRSAPFSTPSFLSPPPTSLSLPIVNYHYCDSLHLSRTCRHRHHSPWCFLLFWLSLLKPL